jgi:adenine-specific DNA methylase
MGQMLYAIANKKPGKPDFRVPVQDDLDAIRAAEAELARKKPLWEAQDIIPSEAIPDGLKTSESLRYGMYVWSDMLSPRQLLAMGTFVETFHELREDMDAAIGDERAAAVQVYLAIALNKAPNYNSQLSVWHPYRTSVANTFNRHDFAFAWSHGEFDSSADLLPWTINQIVSAYREMAKLLAPPKTTLEGGSIEHGPLTLLQGNAADLSALTDHSVQAIITDPPYYDNVMYAELSDFFYVWLKRTVGHLYPEWFAAQLTDKDAEAVANPARFAGLGRKKKALAEQDYERKMEAAFREMHRVLADDGVLTVMFTHKRVEAWDTLASALINAGFSVQSSWPVHTESEHSLHQAKKNAAQSTILLACRKRAAGAQGGAPVWWDDIASQVRYVAREKASEFAERGISGVDLYLSTFGPVLAVISEHWPVLTSEVDERTSQPKPLRPETALDLARQEVIALRKRGLLLGREIQFDEVTDWYLMAWDAFRAEQFPADEARKLALALGLDVERDLVAWRVVGKKGSDVTLLQPKNRRVRGKVDPEADHFDTMLDAVHTALLVYDEDGAVACEAFLKRAGLMADSTFIACLQAMINAVPRTKIKGKFIRPEAALLDKLRAAFFEELAVLVEEGATEQARQMELWYNADS